MDDTYQFADHLRTHGPSRLGQRLWWVPVVGGVVAVIADAVYMAAEPVHELSVAVAVAGPLVAAFLMLVAWASLGIADWTYPEERRYREAHQVATTRALAYIQAGRRTAEQRRTDESTLDSVDGQRPPEWIDDFAWTDSVQIRRASPRLAQL